MNVKLILGWICIEASVVVAVLRIEFLQLHWLAWAIGLFLLGATLVWRAKREKRRKEGDDELEDVELSDIDGADGD
jgi:hypothetical protein